MNQDPILQFEEDKKKYIAGYKNDSTWNKVSVQWLERAFHQKYMYNFSWMGRPIIQLPGDMAAFQEIIWAARPDLVIETGIAHGGSLILSASMLALLDYCEAIEMKTGLDPQKPKRRVLGIDIDIRAHNRSAIEAHPMSNRIDMLEGSSISDEILNKVRLIADKHSRVLVCLDSSHTHDHVLKELELYAPLVSKGSYCMVFDTIIEDLPADMFPDRPWKKGDNSKTAVHAFLERLKKEDIKGRDGQKLNFEIDKGIENKLLLSSMPDGILKRV